MLAIVGANRDKNVNVLRAVLRDKRLDEEVESLMALFAEKHQ